MSAPLWRRTLTDRTSTGKTLKKKSLDYQQWRGLEIQLWPSRNLHAHGSMRVESIKVNPMPHGYRTWYLICVRYCKKMALMKKSNVCALDSETQKNKNPTDTSNEQAHTSTMLMCLVIGLFFLKHHFHTSQSLRSSRDLKISHNNPPNIK